jgi:3-hydroxyisobutyrate dehydrogenase
VKIGFIGLGNMGAAAAMNILRRGYDLRVYDLDRSRAAQLIAAGATWAPSPADIAGAVDVVITMVPGPKEVGCVMRDAGGILSRVRPGLSWVDMTTNHPAVFRAAAAELLARGCKSVDAPVTGAVDGAIQGRLTLFAGGETDHVAELRPLLETMGRVIHMGPGGSGCVTKLITNQLWFIHAAAIGEALVLGKASGVQPLVLWDALKSSVADSFVCRHDVPSIFAGHYDPSFSLDLCCKDLGLVVDLGEQTGVQIDITRLAQSKFELARQVYGGKAAELHVCKLIEDAANIDLRVSGDWPDHRDAPPLAQGAGVPSRSLK